jgi:subtilisin family serine protease
MPLRVTDDEGNTTLAAVSAAWAYALDNGADVLSLSLAGTDPVLEPFFQALVNDAVNADVVCVAAAGNSGLDDTHWPAACDSTLAVAATTNANQRASFSCWGWFVNIAAPGQNVWSALARNYTRDAAHDFYFSFFFGWDGVNPYMYNSGTSFAAPIVAGAVALVRSKYPGVPVRYIIEHMIATADAVAYDNPIGGRLNAYEALLTYVDAGDGLAGGALAAPRLGPARPNPLRVADAGGTTVAFTLPRAGDVQLAVYDVNGRRVRELAAGRHDAGTHHARWDGLDTGGRRAAPGLYFVAGALDGMARSARITVLP